MLKLARLILLIHGLMCVVYGIIVALDVDRWSQYMGIGLLTGDGQAEVLTMYFGMGGALGLFFCFSALSGRCLYEALLTLVISMKGVTYGRILGYWLFDTNEYILSALAYDIPLLLVSMFCYWRLFIPRAPFQSISATEISK